MTMPRVSLVEIPLCILLLVGIGMVIHARLYQRIDKTTTKRNIAENKEEIIKSNAPRGIGYRVIQLVGLLIVVPTVAILACEECITKEVAGTILASIAGYALGSVSKEDN